MVDLTIFIVSWNCKQYLADCLRSIEATGSRLSNHVIVIDNNSTDGTVEMVKRDFPRVTFVQNQSNIGFAAANNQAMKMAQARYVMLLNPDTIVHPDGLDALVRFMDQHPSVWAAGPAMLNRDGTPQRTGVRFPSNWNIFCEALFLDRLFPRSRLFGGHKELYADPATSRPVDYVQGACLCARHDAYIKVGGLDQKFFMYFEETDWCYRMKRAGGEVYLCPDARVTHFGGGDVGHYDEQRLVHYHRSLLRFYRKHYSVSSLQVLRVVGVMRSAIRVIMWGTIAVFRPALRTSAQSSQRGYLKTFGILMGRGV
ncbi:MAG: glycosyltransferase family 2 protein [Bacteroidota bacterium]